MLSFMKWETYHFDVLVSTNQTAIDYPTFSVIIANHQTGGRGRYGRVWESGNGNLYLSLVLPDLGRQNAQMAFVAAVVVARALNDFEVRLKWPNDVLLDGRKIAGILLEAGDNKLIVGIGVNVVAHPIGEMNYPVADLGGRITKEQLADKIVHQMSDCLDMFQKKGFAWIREQWLNFSELQVGDKMRVRLPNQINEGEYAGIDENGFLLLKEKNTIRAVSAGDVFKI